MFANSTIERWENRKSDFGSFAREDEEEKSARINSNEKVFFCVCIRHNIVCEFTKAYNDLRACDIKHIPKDRKICIRRWGRQNGESWKGKETISITSVHFFARRGSIHGSQSFD